MEVLRASGVGLWPDVSLDEMSVMLIGVGRLRARAWISETASIRSS